MSRSANKMAADLVRNMQSRIYIILMAVDEYQDRKLSYKSIGSFCGLYEFRGIGMEAIIGTLHVYSPLAILIL